MLRLAFDFIITWRETRTRPNAYLVRVFFPSFPSYLCGFIIILIHYVFSIRIF